MKRFIAPLVVAAVALTPGAAHAKTTVYKGTFQLVGPEADYTSGNFGKVQLVDGRRNDKLSVHVRRLARNATYVYRLQSAVKSCEASAPAGTPVPGWTYRRGGVLRTNRAGVANSTARSRTFKAATGVEYFVGVYATTPTGAQGRLMLCAELRTKSAKHESTTPKHKSEAPKHEAGDAPAQTEDKPRGKTEDAPGHSEDSGPGKSADAPGHSE